MKVLQINSVCGVGSTGRIATELYKILEAHGHECCIAYGRGRAPKNIKTIKIGSIVDIYIHGIMSRIADKQGWYSKRATQKLIIEIEKFKPDIIHLHNLHGYYIHLKELFLYLNNSKLPVIWTLHDCWGFTGHCAYFTYVKCEKWKSQCYKCEQLSSYPKSYFKDNTKINYLIKKEIFTSLSNLTIVTPSKWLAVLVSNSYFNKYPVQVINNGIDLNIFKSKNTSFRQQFELDKKVIILGVASPWCERKGIDYFVDLAEVLTDEYKIVLVGRGAKKQIHERILRISQTDSAVELSAIYNAADVFFNPTLEDNYPTTNLEALACKIPVITFDVGGSPEMVDKRFVVENFDMEKVLEIIQTKAYLDYKFPEKDHLSYQICFKKYLELYSCLEKHT